MKSIMTKKLYNCPSVEVTYIMVSSIICASGDPDIHFGGEGGDPGSAGMPTRGDFLY